MSLFSLYGQQFPRYVGIFKIAIFGHETWPLAKVPEVAPILSFYPKGSKLSLFLLYRQRFPRYVAIFNIVFSQKLFVFLHCISDHVPKIWTCGTLNYPVNRSIIHNIIHCNIHDFMNHKTANNNLRYEYSRGGQP